MTQQITPNIGELASDSAMRDAIHVAVAPMIAGHRLRAGTHVGILKGEAHNVLPDEAACDRNVHKVPPTIIWRMYQNLSNETLPPWWRESIVVTQ